MKKRLLQTAGFAGTVFAYCVTIAAFVPATKPQPEPPKNEGKPPSTKKGAPAPSAEAEEGSGGIPIAFELQEKISAGAPMSDAERSRLAGVKLPAMRFRWTASVSELAPAFLWEAADGRRFLGAREVGPRETDTLGVYAGNSIILPGGRLWLHLAASARLAEWVQQASGNLKGGAAVEVYIEPNAATKTVALRMPVVGTMPSRTLLVTI